MEINSLRRNKEIVEIKEKVDGLIDVFYPIGSYYETSDIGFNPNTAWGGTWVRDTMGLVTVGAYLEDDYAYSGGSEEFEKIVQAQVGETIGEKEHVLTADEMPKHSHSLQGWSFLWGNKNNATYIDSPMRAGNCVSNNPYINSTESGNKGSNKSHNNVQPSIGVMRWHRTA